MVKSGLFLIPFCFLLYGSLIIPPLMPFPSYFLNRSLIIYFLIEIMMTVTELYPRVTVTRKLIQNDGK